MLKKEQLEDMTKCGFSPGCSWCINSNNSGIGDTVLCIENAAHTALELLDKTEAQEKEIQQLTEEIRVLREQLPEDDVPEVLKLAKDTFEWLMSNAIIHPVRKDVATKWVDAAEKVIQAADKVIGGGQ